VECPKCKGRMVYDAPHFEGDTPSARCLNCGHRIWKPVTVIMPVIPTGNAGNTGRPDVAERNREASKLRMRKMRLLNQVNQIRQQEAAL